MDQFTFTMLGKRWRLVHVAGIKNDGDCDAPTTPGKTIRIRQALRGRDREYLETVLHELLHAADWHKEHEWVEDVSAAAARLLCRLGFRLTDRP